MSHFTITEPLADVFHIQDAGQVCFTLIRGSQDTLLWDTGMGFYDVAECIAPYVRGKLHVVLSHAHYDHACGQHYFAQSLVHPIDLKRCRKTVGREIPGLDSQAYERAWYSGKWLRYAERYLSGTPETIQPLQTMSLDLGSLKRSVHPHPRPYRRIHCCLY